MSFRGTLTVVTILALAAAVLYGTADFLGGVASRRASVFAVLATTVPAGAAVVLVVALLGEAPGLGSLLGHGLGSPTSIGGWGAVGWAAVSGLCGAAGLIAFYAGFATAPISVVAPVAARMRGLAYGAAAGAGFGLFFLCLKNAGQSGVLWPVAISRTAGTLVPLFGLAVVITSLYPGMTVLLARWVLGERMRWLQRGGLLLAAAGVVLLTT